MRMTSCHKLCAQQGVETHAGLTDELDRGDRNEDSIMTWKRKRGGIVAGLALLGSTMVPRASVSADTIYVDAEAQLI